MADAAPTRTEQYDKLFPGRQFISTVLDAFTTKSEMSGRLWKIYLMRAAMAGMIISIFYVSSYAIRAAFDEIPIGGTTMLPIGELIGSAVFGFALVFIYYTKSELLTSNMMIGSIGVYYNRRVWARVLRILGLCFLGNALGGLFIAVLLLGSTLLDGGTADQIGHSIDTKLGYVQDGPSGWADLFVRAVLCNVLINLAMLLCYNGMITSDVAKIIAMVVAVFLFAFLGLEHSVANTELFLLWGLEYGIDVGAAAANVGIAIVGNLVGGGILIGLYYAYANDLRRAAKHGHLPGAATD